MADGTQLKGPDDLRTALLARRDQFVQTFTENLMTFALGRGVKYYDMPRVREIVRESAKQDHRLSSIVLGIVRSDAFQMAEVPKPEAQARRPAHGPEPDSIRAFRGKGTGRC